MEKLYHGLGLSSYVLEKIVKAHANVLKYGLETGNEKIIAIDINTGEIVVEKVGTRNKVFWSLKPKYTGSVITVHNHPGSTTFSSNDLFDFGTNHNTICMSIQGHNGNSYSLRKTLDLNVVFPYDKERLQLLMLCIVAQNKFESDAKKQEAFVRLIANADDVKWKFVKGGEIMSDVIMHLYDGDDNDYIFKQEGESEAEYKTRINRLYEKAYADASEETRRLVDETIKGLDEAMQKVSESA
jgi:hypothetical protein